MMGNKSPTACVFIGTAVSCGANITGVHGELDNQIGICYRFCLKQMALELLNSINPIEEELCQLACS